MENCQFYRGSDIVLFVQMRMNNTKVRWQISYCGFDIPISWLELYIYIYIYIYISPCCGLCLRRVSLNLENLRPTHEQNTSFGNLDQHFFTIMSSKMVMFQKKTTNQLGPLQHPHPGMKLEVSTCSADPIDL